jgi:predicted nucleic acid-binding protein
MRVNLDSSALLKRVIEESESEKLRITLREHVNERAVLVSSRLASIEVSRAIRTRLDADLLITYDERMADAGQRNGLRCAMPGR